MIRLPEIVAMTFCALFLAIAACAPRPPETPVFTDAGLCWPLEPDEAFAEWDQYGPFMPATKEWRGRLALLKAMVRPCEAVQ